MKTIKFLLDYLLSFTGLLFSLYIYLAYRSGDVFVQELFVGLGFENFIFFLKKEVFNLPFWIIFNLPGALWVFSVMLILGNKYLKLGKYSFKLMFLPLIIGLLIELLQKLQITNGSYDFMDVIFILLATILGFYLNLNKPKKPIRFFSKSFFIYASFFIIVILSDA